MKKKKLQDAIAKLKKINNKKSTMPILDNVLNDNGKMTTSCLAVEYTINVGFPGRFMMDMRLLDKIVRKLPNGTDIEIRENGDKINLRTDSGEEFYFANNDPVDFPIMDAPEKKYGDIDHAAIELIKKAASFATTDELRPIMQCVCLTDRIAASDAHRLVFYDYKKNFEGTVMVDAKTASVLSNDKYDILVSEEKGRSCRFVKFVNEYESVTFRETEGKYPAYNSVIPVESSINYRINTNELKQAISLALLTANSASKLIAFSFRKNKLKLSTSDLDFDIGFNKTIECFPVDNAKSLTIGFKGTFLLSLLNGRGKTVSLAMTEANRAMIIDDDALLMPMMLND